MLLILTCLLVVLPVVLAGDYHPCSMFAPSRLECRYSARESLEAFRRNSLENINQLSIRIDDSWRNGWTDQVVDEMLRLVARGSARSMQNLGISNTRIRQAPSSIRLFPSLVSLDLNKHDLRVLPQGFLARMHLPSLKYLNLTENRIQSINSRALEGDFSSVLIELSNNLLPTLEQQVFQPILQSKFALLHKPENREAKAVVVENNPISCDCHLAWLFQNGTLLPPILKGDARLLRFSSRNSQDVKDCQSIFEWSQCSNAPKITATESPEMTTEVPNITTESPEITTALPNITTESKETTTALPKNTNSTTAPLNPATAPLNPARAAVNIATITAPDEIGLYIFMAAMGLLFACLLAAAICCCFCLPPVQTTGMSTVMLPPQLVV